MQARMEDLLPVEYFHVVFTLPSQIADMAHQNKASSETLRIIAADPKYLGAKIGTTSVLHTWGSAMTHHPHVHVVVPGGGLSSDGQRWVACRKGFLVSVKVLSRLFRRLFLEGLQAAQGGQAGVLWQPVKAGRPRRLCCKSCAAAQNQLGRLCQTTLRRAGSGIGLPKPLHAPTARQGIAQQYP